MTVVTNTGKVIFLGNFSQFDTNETNSDYEDASALVGTTLSGFAANANIVDAIYDDTNDNGAISSDHFSGSTDTLNGSIIDVAMLVSVEILLDGGSTISRSVVGYQTQDGDVYLTDLFDRIPEGTRMQSLEVTGVSQTGDSSPVSGHQTSGNYYMDDIGFVCFAASTLIRTEHGDTPVEHLKTGDLVATKDNGFQPIRWIGCKHLSATQLGRHTHLRPVRIRAGALGENSPLQDLSVSPQHRILVQSKIASRMFDSCEVLVAAKHLCALEGIASNSEAKGVTYYHLLFDQHEIVTSNGAETESLYTGPEALKSISPSARLEVFGLFPELNDMSYLPKPCRKLINGHAGRQLVARHKKNFTPMRSTCPSDLD